MLIDKDYKRNKQTNEIVKREIVEVCCDKCGKIWQTAYANRKKKKLEQDLCASCRAKYNNALGKPLSERRWGKKESDKPFVCKYCNKPDFIKPYQKRIFCSLICRDLHNESSRYGHLKCSFDLKKNAVAYLLGVILGDGHLKKSGKNTTRVSIAFDNNSKWLHLKDECQKVLDELNVDWFEEENTRSSCKMVGFILPNDILKSFGMLFHGDKYNAHISIPRHIVNNINFAAGLINSDGCVGKYGEYGFCNTKEYITLVLSESLEKNNISFRYYENDGVYDKRTGNVAKKTYRIYVPSSKGNSHKLIDQSLYTVKKYS